MSRSNAARSAPTTMRVVLPIRSRSRHYVEISHIGLVALAAAAQRNDGVLEAAQDPRAAGNKRIADAIDDLLRHRLVERANGITRINDLGRAALTAIEKGDWR